MKKKRLWSDIVIYSLLTIAALYTLFPLCLLYTSDAADD